MPGLSNSIIPRIFDHFKEQLKSNASCGLCDLIPCWKPNKQSDAHYADGEGAGLIPAYSPPKPVEIAKTSTGSSTLVHVIASPISLAVATPKTPLLRVDLNAQDSATIPSSVWSVEKTPGATLPGHILVPEKGTARSQGSELKRTLVDSSTPALIPITKADTSLNSHISMHDITTEMSWPGSPSYALPGKFVDGNFGGKRKGNALRRWASKGGKAVREILRRN